MSLLLMLYAPLLPWGGGTIGYKTVFQVYTTKVSEIKPGEEKFFSNER